MTDSKPTEAEKKAAATAQQGAEALKDAEKADKERHEKFKPSKEQPDENPAASAQMTAEYGELDRTFSDGVEVEPEVVEVEKKDKGPKATTVKKEDK